VFRIVVVESQARRDRLIHIVERLPFDPAYQVTIEEYAPTRNAQQNRRYWLLLSLMGKHTGHDRDELHDFFKEKFLGTREIVVAGERAIIRPSTRRLKTKEFAEYMDKVENFAIEELQIWLE
jgi:hypothetical protein